ncbi:glycosyltransferase family 39 protein [Curtobacterium sp. MCBD17_003]|uniref:ArnT family glycosyltransferase n=1 Tax=Curtobacterium sp. MCBD17_003 TaxID=2175667 RepID=UPI000DA6DDE3|nr:glycosyltransferase family 39 protein [Curtobacterium sp. MCBD17_003]WIE55753.1 glycosyltransferase family 39 protein [Curtobacterium sp. MCBD17_003]
MTSHPATLIDRPDHPAERRTAERRSAVVRLFLGDRADAAWLRPAFWALLLLTAVLYLWDITVSGSANSFYAAAVQAGSESWKSWFFGSLDTADFITVDKPPASLWVMGLSARIFGFSSASMLVPEALMAVASVALTWGVVRRTLARLGGTTANVGALLAGFVLAMTPAAALIFRFDNPDALLVLLMTAAAYCTVRALPRGSWRWFALAGVALGFAFLTKMLQGLLVMPALGLVYVFAAQATWRKRVVGAVIGVVSLVVAAGWWVLTVALWPADARPYIGGSTDNTVLDLVFGYNGLGRIFGGDGNGGGGGGGMTGGTAGSSFGGSTGLERLFSSEMGLEISWLLPAALLALVLGLVAAGRRPLADPARAGLVLWGGWLLVTGLVFSYMSGTIHPYYTVALAPAIAGLVGTGGAMLWARRRSALGTLGLAAMIAITASWSWALLGENATWVPWLRWVVLVGGFLSAGAVAVGTLPTLRRLVAVGVLAGTLFGLTGTTAYAVATTTVGHTGSIPSVGPAGSGSSGTGGAAGGMGGGMPGGTGGPGGSSSDATTGSGAGTGMPPGGSGGSDSDATTGQPPAGAPGSSSGTSGTSDGGGRAADAGSMGGGSQTTSTALQKLLEASDAKWAAAVNGSQSAAQLELDTDQAVMAIGGWSSDPTPTLAQFKAWVKEGKVGYYIVSSGMGGGMGGGPGGSSAADTSGSAGDTSGSAGDTSGSVDGDDGGAGGGMPGGQSTSTASAIQAWVEAHFTAKTVGGQTVYDLSGD